jgi:hypothetical protein
MLPEKDSVLEKSPHFYPNNIIVCSYAALYAATYLLPNFMQECKRYALENRLREKVVVIGGGFAGLSAVAVASCWSHYGGTNRLKC